MAERLGTGLQNLLQRFESASDLPQKTMNKFMVFLCPISHVKLDCKWRWGIKNSATAEGFLREGYTTPGYPIRHPL